MAERGYTLLGWIVWRFGKLYARRRWRQVGPIKRSIVSAGVVAPIAVLLVRKVRRADG